MDDAVAAAMTAHGGEITFGPSAIATIGALIRCRDPAGDDVGAITHETPSHS